MARVSKKRKLEEIESRSGLEGVLYFRRGGKKDIFNSIFALHKKGRVIIMDLWSVSKLGNILVYFKILER